MKLYGSLVNRLNENKMFCDEIKVGTGVTEYLYSDRHAYEVVAVKDQKHISIREYAHKLVGEPYSNDWELISDESNPIIELTKRGNYWYQKRTVTYEDFDTEDPEIMLWLILRGFDPEKIRKNRKQTKYYRLNISIGVADYYYDYEL